MSSSKEKRSKDLDNTTYPLKHQHLDNDMDRDFSFEEIDPDIEFDKIDDDNIDNNDNKTDRDKNKDKAENQGSLILSSIEEDDNKGSKVWNYFDKFVDDRGVLWTKYRYCGYE